MTPPSASRTDTPLGGASSSRSPGATLTTLPADALAAAWHHRERLLASAAMVVAAAGHDPDVAGCAPAACRLAASPDGPAWCALALQLTRCVTPDTAVTPVALDTALAAFHGTLLEAADAVRHCRQRVHPTGTCWFAAAPGLDGCLPVLRALHRLA